MDNQKLLKIVGYLLLGVYVVGNLLMIFRVDHLNIQFGPELHAKFSIYSSRGFFIAYHVWGVIIALVTGYAMYKEIRVLFLIGMLLLLLIMFYPTAVSGPADQPAAQPAQESPAAPASDSAARP